jgi:hypothetical protein
LSLVYSTLILDYRPSYADSQIKAHGVVIMTAGQFSQQLHAVLKNARMIRAVTVLD